MLHIESARTRTTSCCRLVYRFMISWTRPHISTFLFSHFDEESGIFSSQNNLRVTLTRSSCPLSGFGIPNLDNRLRPLLTLRSQHRTDPSQTYALLHFLLRITYPPATILRVVQNSLFLSVYLVLSVLIFSLLKLTLPCLTIGLYTFQFSPPSIRFIKSRHHEVKHRLRSAPSRTMPEVAMDLTC